MYNCARSRFHYITHSSEHIATTRASNKHNFPPGDRPSATAKGKKKKNHGEVDLYTPWSNLNYKDLTAH